MGSTSGAGLNRPNGFPRTLLLLAVVALAAAPPVQAVNQCQDGSCVACAPAIGGVLSPLIPGGIGGTPIAFVDPGDNSRRRFIATQQGRIMLWDGSTGAITEFLDLRDGELGQPGRVLDDAPSRGLLAMAVAPDYAATGHFFVHYTSVARAALGIEAGDIVVERFSRAPGDPTHADPASGLLILAVRHPAPSHNGGWLAFGPNDGYLYVTLGDGGGACDSEGQNAQNVHELLGKMLRLDVTSAPGGADCGDDDVASASYAIPASNPLVGKSGCDEIWSYGLRNPFRFSFDRITGDIFLGDVGQDNWEEFHFQSATLPAHAAPMNFGWVVREGCDVAGVPPSSCGCSGDECPPAINVCEYPAAGDYWDPVFCHSNPGGWASALGGYRYRGRFVPPLAGRYLYSDASRGDIWISTAFDPSNLASAASCCWDTGNGGIFSFAEDHLGELYVVNGFTGRVFCIHDGAGCFWAAWGGLFEDDFESDGLTRWSAVEPPLP
jgi:glucose/arabinose dehydrogenase